MSVAKESVRTPGRWFARGCKVISLDANRYIAECNSTEDALLCAASPDLLAACKAALTFLDGLNGTFAESQQLAAAIAKATGE